MFSKLYLVAQMTADDPQICHFLGVFFNYPQKFSDVGLQDTFQILHLIFQCSVFLQNILDTFENEPFFTLRKVPKDCSFSVKSILLNLVFDVGRMLGPAVDEGKGEGDVNVKLLVEFSSYAISKPFFIMAISWCGNTSSERCWANLINHFYFCSKVKFFNTG
jgi:hypothetical protein